MNGLDTGRPSLRFMRPEITMFHERLPRATISAREIHVWAFSLEVSLETRLQCSRWLSESERERADRLRFEQLRNHFIVAHGCLRHILSRYSDSPPGALEIVQAVGEKPRLARGGPPEESLRFNLTHSHGQGMMAVAKGFEIGIDLEQVRDEVEHVKLAERFFSRAERDFIKTEKGERQRTLFFRHWVGKEAVLKATGVGLRLPLDRCELVMADKRDEAVVHLRDTVDAVQSWLVKFLPLESGWVGAVAAEGTDWTVTYRGLGRADS